MKNVKICIIFFLYTAYIHIKYTTLIERITTNTTRMYKYFYKIYFRYIFAYLYIIVFCIAVIMRIIFLHYGNTNAVLY